MKTKNEKVFLAFEIIASELVVLNCLYQGENYLPSALSFLGNTFEILHICNRDFL